MPLLLLVLAALACPPARAGLPVSLRFYEDSTNALTPEEVVRRAEALEWKPVEGRHARFGFSRSTFWFRFRIEEPKDPLVGQDPLLVEVPNAYLQRITLTSARGGVPLRTLVSGTAVPRSARSPAVLPTGSHSFRLSSPRSPDTDYFLSIRGDFPLALPLTVWPASEYAYHHWTGMLFVGFFFGMLALAALFNGFLAFSLRSPIYWHYSAFVASVTMLYLGHEGLSMQLLWPEATWWTAREMHFYGALAIFFYAGFVREFLATRVYTPWLHRVLLVCVGLSTVRGIWTLISPTQLVVMIGETAVVLTNLVVMLIGVRALWLGVRSARYFFLSSLVFNLAMVLFVLQESNLIYLGEFIARSPHFGTMLEVILLSLALGDRIRLTNLELAMQKSAVVHAEKMGALGRMAGEIAHEINNPLAIIQGNSHLLTTMELPAEARAIAATIEATTTRISRVVKGMRALARDSRSDPLQLAQAAAVLQDTLVLCHDRVTSAGVKLHTPEAEPRLHLRCRSSEICQVLVNLLNNALDAVEGRPGAWVRLELKEQGGYLEFSVTDNGPGIPKAIRARIQEPFFTTKEAGKGLGLGLSISRTIVENHGGKIWLDEASQHTRFAFTVPTGS